MVPMLFYSFNILTFPQDSPKTSWFLFPAGTLATAVGTLTVIGTVSTSSLNADIIVLLQIIAQTWHVQLLWFQDSLTPSFLIGWISTGGSTIHLKRN